MEVDTGTGDNHYPMNLSISCRRMERTIDRGPPGLLLAPKVVSGNGAWGGGIMITTAIIQQVNDRLQCAGTIASQLTQKKKELPPKKVSVKRR